MSFRDVLWSARCAPHSTLCLIKLISLIFIRYQRYHLSPGRRRYSHSHSQKSYRMTNTNRQKRQIDFISRFSVITLSFNCPWGLFSTLKSLPNYCAFEPVFRFWEVVKQSIPDSFWDGRLCWLGLRTGLQCVRRFKKPWKSLPAEQLHPFKRYKSKLGETHQCFILSLCALSAAPELAQNKAQEEHAG